MPSYRKKRPCGKQTGHNDGGDNKIPMIVEMLDNTACDHLLIERDPAGGEHGGKKKNRRFAPTTICPQQPDNTGNAERSAKDRGGTMQCPMKIGALNAIGSLKKTDELNQIVCPQDNACDCNKTNFFKARIILRKKIEYRQTPEDGEIGRA